MKRTVAILALAACAVAFAAAANTFSAEGDFSSFGSNLEWEPDCHKPSKPYSPDEDELRRYVDQAKSYVACVNDQAREDAEYAVAQIKEGRDDAVQEMIRDVQSLR